MMNDKVDNNLFLFLKIMSINLLTLFEYISFEFYSL
jgi:hypothetical protein